jgi:hypothetical protein
MTARPIHFVQLSLREITPRHAVAVRRAGGRGRPSRGCTFELLVR